MSASQVTSYVSPQVEDIQRALSRRVSPEDGICDKTEFNMVQSSMSQTYVTWKGFFPKKNLVKFLGSLPSEQVAKYKQSDHLKNKVDRDLKERPERMTVEYQKW